VCAKLNNLGGGYRSSEPGYFYIQKIFISNTSFLKFGISNDPDKRIKKQYRKLHHRLHASIAKRFFWKDGGIPRLVENQVKGFFGTLCGHGEEYAGKYDGSTETLPLRCFDKVVDIAEMNFPDRSEGQNLS